MAKQWVVIGRTPPLFSLNHQENVFPNAAHLSIHANRKFFFCRSGSECFTARQRDALVKPNLCSKPIIKPVIGISTAHPPLVDKKNVRFVEIVVIESSPRIRTIWIEENPRIIWVTTEVRLVLFPSFLLKYSHQVLEAMRVLRIAWLAVAQFQVQAKIHLLLKFSTSAISDYVNITV